MTFHDRFSPYMRYALFGVFVPCINTRSLSKHMIPARHCNEDFIKAEKRILNQQAVTKYRSTGIGTIFRPEVLVEAVKRKKALQAQDKLAAGPDYKDVGLVSQTKRGLTINPIILKRLG
ncbi:hypothetical protein FFV09_04950 [Saccharibacillus brassicae]|uniref:Uncharacterized protein n=1 Tax=Saccharibacillus brassicae TaxID=2583377 RepID=A0A4Y6UT74_SACBS|nr:hypothetical protein FFV09_04950 [Saccharibacillus brassicae]